MNLRTPVKKIPRIAGAYEKRLARLGIKTVGDLLFHFPHRYENYSSVSCIKDAKIGDTVCVKGEIIKIENDVTRLRRLALTKAIIKDQTGIIQAVWFNQPYLKDTLNIKESVCLAGKLELRKEGPVLSNPIYEKLNKEEQIHTGRIIPVYPETEGLSSRWLRYVLFPLLQEFCPKIPETLPQEILEKENLLAMRKALWQIHFPDSEETAKRARERFSFEEVFLLQLKLLKEKKSVKQKRAFCVPSQKEIIKELLAGLSFQLTSAQHKTAWEILEDMKKQEPMRRLLQGDVGSGKTIVAAIAMLNGAESGFQTAFMAPTEILAKQHFQTLADIMGNFNQKIGLLTGTENKIAERGKEKQTNRQKLLCAIKKNEVRIVIGTHALIRGAVKFDKLALVVIDEQHRFGIEQRSKLLKDKVPLPHLLTMTATPIPRSLALTLYGDLDVSVIDELPRGRKKIKTSIVPPKERPLAYEFIRQKIQEEKKQVFVICPRISSESKPLPTTSDFLLGNIAEETKEEVKAVKQEYEKLSKKIFPEFRVNMLHGQMPSLQKESIMRKMREGEIDILVSTSVVEVGVDVPNAFAIIIEGAERFGLAQLHQFRGRVGRSNLKAYCFLFPSASNEKSRQRLRALVNSNDGFELAEKDLQIRGPGTFVGKKQSGLSNLVIASLGDLRLIQRARKQANKILENSPDLAKYINLQKRLKRFGAEVHLE